MSVLFQGILLGLMVSIPLGPIGVICIQRTLNKGLVSGLISGMGAAFADTLLAFIAVLGIGFVISFIEEQQLMLELVGSLFILFIGLKIFNTNPAIALKKQRYSRKKKLSSDFISILLLTLTNPLTIFVFIGVFAGFNMITESAFTSTLIIIGVFAGASLWWFTLSSMINMLKSKFRLKRLWWMNKIAGTFLVVFGFVILIRLIFDNYLN